MAKIIFRKAHVADAEGMAEVMREGLKQKTWLYTGTNRYKKDRLDDLKEKLAEKNPSSVFIVAVKEKKIVGSLNYDFRKSSRLEHRISLGWGVHPDFQGQGVGTGLLSYAIAYAKKRGFVRAKAEIAVEKKGSMRMAEKCGFTMEGTKKKASLTDDGRYIDTVIVGKLL